MPIATFVMAAGTGLMAVAAVIGTVITLCAQRRTRQGPANSSENPPCSGACLVTALPRVGEIVLNDRFILIIVRSCELAGELTSLKVALECEGARPTNQTAEGCARRVIESQAPKSDRPSASLRSSSRGRLASP